MEGAFMSEEEQPSISSYDAAAWRSPPSGSNGAKERIPWASLLGVITALAIVFCGLGYLQYKRSVILSGGPDPAVEVEGREYVASLLRDPSSGQFRNTAVKGECLTGEVNGKNAFGGYAGFIRFFYNRKTGVGRTEPDADGLLKVLNPTEHLVAQTQFGFAYSDCLASAVDSSSPGA